MLSRHGVQQDPHKLWVPTDILLHDNKKEFQSLIDIMNYLGKFSPPIAEVCKSIEKTHTNKAEWIWKLHK